MINSLVRNCVMPGCVTVLQNRPARCDDGIDLPVDVSVEMFVVVLKFCFDTIPVQLPQTCFKKPQYFFFQS